MYEAQIQKGAELLDTHFGGPEWRERINTDSLLMRNIHNCILGQLFGNYWDALSTLGVREYQTYLANERVPVASDYGFQMPMDTDDWMDNGYQTLQAEWVTYLTSKAAEEAKSAL